MDWVVCEGAIYVQKRDTKQLLPYSAILTVRSSQFKVARTAEQKYVDKNRAVNKNTLGYGTGGSDIDIQYKHF